MQFPHIHVALPVMDEPEWLPVILSLIEQQTYRHFSVVVCVNQPEAWWVDPSRLSACKNNTQSLSLLENVSGFPVEVIDRSSRGAGWIGKRHGVGWARKTVMDQISRKAEPDDIILSLDADTLFSECYFESVAEAMSTHPHATALSIPYYHHLPDDQDAARAILRYEIYMRYYLLNLWRIKSPYAFTALGSAMAFPVWAYRKVRGMTPKLSGEDFYFLQKLRKAGKLINWNREKVFPAARFSSRVFFGTGPAMIRGSGGDWGSYPVYSYRLFDEIGESYSFFKEMYIRTLETPVTRILQEQTGEEDPFATLRRNSREMHQFIRACHEKFDGLRILQYLKKRHQEEGGQDEENLVDWLKTFYPEEMISLMLDSGNTEPETRTGAKRSSAKPNANRDQKKFSFTDSSLEEIDQVRNFLVVEEDRVRKENPLF